MTTLTATDARRDFFELVKRTAKGHRVYRIRHRQGSAVLISEEDYGSLLETLELLAIPGFRASIKHSVAQMKKGQTYSFAQVLEDRGVSPYTIRFTREAAKDVNKLPPRLKQKLGEILQGHIALDPFSGKKLLGDLQGFYSVRLTYQDRIVYSVNAASRTVFVHRARTHYG